MSKRPDFGNDLATLNENVNSAVGDVLQVLQEKRTVHRPSIVKKEDAEQGKGDDLGTEVDKSKQLPTKNSVRGQRSASRSRITNAIERDEPLENVTTRLRQKTNELLTEAALRQRLKKENPATRQDIVEAALADWFRKHGYTRKHGEEVVD